MKDEVITGKALLAGKLSLPDWKKEGENLKPASTINSSKSMSLPPDCVMILPVLVVGSREN
jgi:hypothetical protein